MSSKHNRRKRNKNNLSEVGSVPHLVERVQVAQTDSSSGKTYEEARWAYLSPSFRTAHNRLRQARGLPTIPPPKIDMYVPPETPAAKPFDPTNPEFVASVREFMGPTMRTPGEEGFTINGSKVK